MCMVSLFWVFHNQTLTGYSKKNQAGEVENMEFPELLKKEHAEIPEVN